MGRHKGGEGPTARKVEGTEDPRPPPPPPPEKKKIPNPPPGPGGGKRGGGPPPPARVTTRILNPHPGPGGVKRVVEPPFHQSREWKRRYVKLEDITMCCVDHAPRIICGGCYFSLQDENFYVFCFFWLQLRHAKFPG